METKETQENSDGGAGLAAATGSAVVQVSVNGGLHENASKLVWWLAKMALTVHILPETRAALGDKPGAVLDAHFAGSNGGGLSGGPSQGGKTT